MIGAIRRHTIALPRSWLGLFLIVVALLTSCLTPLGGSAQEAPAPGTVSESVVPEPERSRIGRPAEPISSKHVYDLTQVLADEQVAVIESDASRLHRHGVPAVVVVHPSDISRDQAAALAEDVRTDWGIESSPGADDGLLILVTIPQSRAGPAYSTLSWGQNALPHFGVNPTTSDRIQSMWIDPALSGGHVYEATIYGLRNLIYQSIYDPAPQAPLSDLQQNVQSLLDVLGPIVAIASLAAVLAGWIPRGAFPYERSAMTRDWAMPVIAGLLFAASVWSRSTFGAWFSVIAICVAVAAWVACDPMPEDAGSSGAREGAA